MNEKRRDLTDYFWLNRYLYRSAIQFVKITIFYVYPRQKKFNKIET
jgi:hypothetical protein